MTDNPVNIANRRKAAKVRSDAALLRKAAEVAYRMECHAVSNACDRLARMLDKDARVLTASIRASGGTLTQVSQVAENTIAK